MEMQRSRGRTAGTAERNRPDKETKQTLVVGLAVTGDALVEHLVARGDDVVVIEDTPASTDAYTARVTRAQGPRCARGGGADGRGHERHRGVELPSSCPARACPSVIR